MQVRVAWEYTNDDDEALDCCRVLYVYLHPRTKRVLYLGKADRSSVRERLKGKHKNDIFEFMSGQFGLSSMSLQVGHLYLPEGRRFSSAVLSDVESLLIAILNPPANIQSTQSRIARPGMVVRCTDDWPHRIKEFQDA